MRPRWPVINRNATGYLVYCDDELLTQAPVKRDQIEWWEQKRKTHKQSKCPECHRWAIWTPKKTS